MRVEMLCTEAQDFVYRYRAQVDADRGEVQRHDVARRRYGGQRKELSECLDQLRAVSGRRQINAKGRRLSMILRHRRGAFSVAPLCPPPARVVG